MQSGVLYFFGKFANPRKHPYGKGSKYVSNEDPGGVRRLTFNMGQLLEVTLVYVVSFQAIQSYVSA